MAAKYILSSTYLLLFFVLPLALDTLSVSLDDSSLDDTAATTDLFIFNIRF